MESPDAEPVAPGLQETLQAYAPAQVTPLREEEMQHGIKFLRHPKVIGSGSAAKRTFLKNKGLTDEEIDECFQRVSSMPPPPPETHVDAPPPGASAAPLPVPQPLQMTPEAAPRSSWTGAILSAAILAAGAYGVGSLVAPYVKAWWRGGSAADDQKDDTSVEILRLLGSLRSRQDELDAKVSQFAYKASQDVQELKEMVVSVHTESAHEAAASPRRGAVASTLRVDAPPFHSSHTSQPAHPSNGAFAVKGLSAAAVLSTPSPPAQSKLPFSSLLLDERPAPASESPGNSPHPADYVSILKMLEQGQSPDGVRTDINGKPSDPNAKPTPSTIAKRPKPWELHAPSAPWQGPAAPSTFGPRVPEPKSEAASTSVGGVLPSSSTESSQYESAGGVPDAAAPAGTAATPDAVHDDGCADSPEVQTAQPSKGESPLTPEVGAPGSNNATPRDEGKPLISHRLNETFATDELFEELKDKDKMGKRGEIILVAQLIVCFLVAFPPMRLHGFLYLSGVLSMIAGAVAVLYAVLSLGRNFSPLVAPRKNSKLVTGGMYQYMRHPMYAGLIFLALGWSAVSHSESRTLLSLLLFCVLDFKARKEEQAMTERHGADYAAYKASVSRFFPYVY